MAKRKLGSSKSFEKVYKKFTRNNEGFKQNNQKALKLLEEDYFSLPLKPHRLSGHLMGMLACSCGYDCRIIFSVEKGKEKIEEIILLIDIGTHNEVY